MIGTIEKAKGTYLFVQMPWSTYVGGKVMCTDGKLRTLKRISITADTFFSIPAAVTVDGKTVTGYVTTSDVDLDESYYLFHSYKSHVNGDLLPFIHIPHIPDYDPYEFCNVCSWWAKDIRPVRHNVKPVDDAIAKMPEFKRAYARDFWTYLTDSSAECPLEENYEIGPETRWCIRAELAAYDTQTGELI